MREKIITARSRVKARQVSRFPQESYAQLVETPAAYVYAGTALVVNNPESPISGKR
jgi:hypothetical protein